LELICAATAEETVLVEDVAGRSLRGEAILGIIAGGLDRTAVQLAAAAVAVDIVGVPLDNRAVEAAGE